MPLFPPPLLPGQRIGIVAPASPITLEDAAVRTTYERLESFGLEVEEAPQCRAQTGHTAGTPEVRAAALEAFFADPEIGAIMAFWGGYQSHQLLEHIDESVLVANPKLLVGYSDVTALSLGLYCRTGLVGLSGPAGITFAKPVVPAYSWSNLAPLLFGSGLNHTIRASESYTTNAWYEDPDAGMIFQPSSGWSTVQPGRATGPCIAGNLGSMLLLAGTPYWPDLTGAILIVEEDEAETPETVDRLFTHLRHTGAFEKISAFGVGRFPDAVGFSPPDSFEDILARALRGYDFPVMTELDYGHTDPIATLPIGSRIEFDADAQQIQLVESPTGA